LVLRYAHFLVQNKTISSCSCSCTAPAASVAQARCDSGARWSGLPPTLKSFRTINAAVDPVSQHIFRPQRSGVRARRGCGGEHPSGPPPVQGPVFLRPIAAMSWAVANRSFGNVERPNRRRKATASHTDGVEWGACVGDLGVAPRRRLHLRGLRRIKSPVFHACFCDLPARIVLQRRLVQRMDGRTADVTPGFKDKPECKNTCAPGSSYTHASTR
jgi:hypothetical protein